MLNHIVLVSLKDGVTDAQVQAALDGFAGLLDVIPEMRAADCGRDAGFRPGNADLALTATFDSVEDYATYRDHPAHRSYAQELLQPFAETYTVVQFPGRG